MIILRLREVIRDYERRTGERLTYTQIAERTGLSRATVETLASRPSYNTTLSTVDKLCAVLGCSLTDLLSHRPSDADETGPVKPEQ